MTINKDADQSNDRLWLVVATYPKGEDAIIVRSLNSDGRIIPMSREDADDLAEAIDWHPSLHGVGRVVPVRFHTGGDDE